MKKIFTVIILFSLLVGISFAQQKKQEPTIGLGFEFHMFPAVAMQENWNIMQEGWGRFYGPTVYVPIVIGGILIEPSLSYASWSVEFDFDDPEFSYKETTAYWRIVIGTFILLEKDKLRFYAGARIGKTWTKDKRQAMDNDGKYTEIYNDFSDELFLIEPTIGAEYFISDNFSFGGEGMYAIVAQIDKNDTYTETQKLSTIIPRFIVRFYL